MELLQHSVLSLHGACKQVEDAAAPGRPNMEEVKAGAGKVVSELLSLEATIGLLVSELRSAPAPAAGAGGFVQSAGSQPQGRPAAAGGSAEARAAAIAAQALAGMDSDDGAEEGAGESQGSVFSFGRQAHPRQAGGLTQPPSLPVATPMLARGAAGRAAAAASQEQTPSSSHCSASSSEPSLGDVLRPAPCALLPPAKDARYATVQPMDHAGWDAGGAWRRSGMMQKHSDKGYWKDMDMSWTGRTFIEHALIDVSSSHVKYFTQTPVHPTLPLWNGETLKQLTVLNDCRMATCRGQHDEHAPGRTSAGSPGTCRQMEGARPAAGAAAGADGGGGCGT